MDVSRLLSTPRTPRIQRSFHPSSPSGSPSIRQYIHLQQKKRSTELSRDEKVEIRALRKYAGFTYPQIAQQTGKSQRQVQLALNSPVTPQKNCYTNRRKNAFSTPEREKLKQWMLSDPSYRYISWRDLRFFLPPEYTRYGETALFSALRRLGFSRRKRPRRIHRTPANERARVRFCKQCLERWPDEKDWENIIFSNKTWATNDPMWKRWVTILDTETPEDFALLRRSPHGWMLWGCFAGAQKGPSFIWEKGYGGINQHNYCSLILPLVRAFFLERGGGYFQQDNAPTHKARLTQDVLKQMGIPVLRWPANSPDLNPIENVWFWMKDWIENHYDLQSLNVQQLREAIEAAWEAVPASFLLELAHSMPRRLRKCIELKGKSTGY